jgi:hypothetical protein
MGWWKVQGTDDLVGDDVFGILRRATTAVAEEYTRAFGRAPTRAEWGHLIQDALQPIVDLDSSSRQSLFAENALPRFIDIVLEAHVEKNE